ncbi:MAG: hypothetical protein JWM43_1773 [Acidobacteriaceae bacterium]|nr:hypothetical protein [Acidobacteriaceae bacterium]
MGFTARLALCSRSLVAALSLRNAVFAVALPLFSFSALAQIGGTGSIQGTVTDPSGAVVPGASITVTSTATNAVLTQQSSSSGFYSLAAVPPGSYVVIVTAPGFQKLAQQNVVVDALAVATVNLTLTLGATTDTVTVVDAPPQLETTNATLGSVMRNELYTSLPLAMNAGPRDPTAFVALVPGVQALSSQAAGTSFASFNGGQPYMNEVYVEGIPMTNAAAQGETRNLAYSVSVEAIDQFQVETNNSPSMYQGQGIENFTIKSGSNRFHGAAYEYFRNTVLDARGYFPTVAQGRQIEKQNQFGGRVGGFILKDKLFFFGNYDGYRYRATSNPTTQSVPNTAFRAGNFSQLIPAGTNCNNTPVAGCIFDPLSTTATGGRTAFPGNVIPASRISSVSNSLGSYLPNVDPSLGFGNNYTAIVPVGLNTNSVTARLDYNFSQKQRAYVIFSKGSYVTVPFAGISANTSALPLPYAATRIVTEKPMTIQFHHVYTLTPNLLNQFGYSYARLDIPISSATAAGQYPIKAGLAGLPAGQASNAFPTINFAGPNSPQSWAGTNSQAFNEVANTYVVQDNVQWVKGKHSLTIGGQFQWLQDNFTSPADRSNATFSFANSQTAATGNLLATTGNAYASYLLGAPDSASVNENSVITTGARYRDFAAYVQDNYRLTDKLTLNLGVRYDIMGVFHEAKDRTSFLNPTLANPAVNGYPGALQFTGNGVASCNCATPLKTHYGNVGPRVALAYSPTSKTVVRAGFAIMYAHGNGTSGRGGGRNGTGQLGYNANPSFPSALGNGAPAFFWSGGNTLPAAYSTISQGGLPAYQKAPFFDPTLNSGFYTGGPSGGGITYGDPEIGGRSPAYNNYTLSLQQALTQNLTLTLAYSGSQGHYLPSGVGRVDWANQIDPRYLALGNDLNLAVNVPANVVKYNADAAAAGLPAYKAPFSNYNNSFGRALTRFPQYSAVTDIWGGVGNSNYNGLQVILNQRVSNGLTFNVAYVWSREIDDVTNARTVYNVRQERAIGAIDRTHVITSSATYKLPFGKGHTFGTSKYISPLVSGYEVSSIVLVASGAPLAITGSCNTPFTGGLCVPNLNPNFVGSPVINGGLGSGNNNAITNHTTAYIDKNAFINPAAFTFGNAARSAPYNLRNPYTWNQDVTVRRTFGIWESLKLEAAVSAFNVYNTVNFGGVNVNVTSTTFGTVSSQANSPRKLQGEARITF